MIKLSNKVISAIVGCVFVAGGVSVTAAISNNKPNIDTDSTVTSYSDSSMQTNSFVSSSVSSLVSSTISSKANTPTNSSVNSSIPSKGTANNMADEANGVDEIKKATDDGVSQIHEETSKAVSQITNTQNAQDTTEAAHKKYMAELLKQNQENMRWPVVDPDTGCEIAPNQSNYEKIRAELGGDAGLVNPDKSTACQKAREQAKQKFIEQDKKENPQNYATSSKMTSK